MAKEIPMDLINQLQISLRREAKLSSYDPGEVSLPSLPSVEDAIVELDPSPPYLRCKHCKGKLLRGIESLICVFCGKQQRTSDNPPDPIKFTLTFGYRLLLSSLNLNGSETVEITKETSGSKRGRNAPIEVIPLSNLLDLEIQWQAEEEKLTTSSSNEKLVQGKVSLNLGGVDLDNFFIGGAAPEVQSAQNKSGESERSNVFKDPRSLSLFENVDSTGSSKLQQGGNLSLFEKKNGEESISSKEQGSLSLFERRDIQGSISSKEHGNLNLFERKDAQEIFSSKEHENVSLFAGKDAQECSSSKEQGNLSPFERIQPSEAAAKSVKDEIGNSSSNWEVDFQSAGKRTLSEQPNSVDPFVSASVDLSAHMDSFFGSGKDGKPKDSFAASGSTAGNWFQDDLFGNITHQEQQNNSNVHNKDAGKKEDANGTSSVNIDWIEDNLWRTSTNKASDKKTTDFEDDDWNDFASSVNAKTPNFSFLQSRAETFDGTTDFKNGGRIESGKRSSPSMDWIQGEQQQISTSTAVPDKTENQEDDLFDAWNDFTGSAISEAPSTSSVQHSIDHMKPSVEQTAETKLLNEANNHECFHFGGLSQPDFSSGHFSNQNNSVKVKVVRSEASTSTSTSTSDRTGHPAGKDAKNEDAAAKTDHVSATKTDDIEILMSQMHDLSFMHESKISVPSNPNAEEFSSVSKD